MFGSLRLLLAAGFLAACLPFASAADIVARGSIVYVNDQPVFQLKDDSGGLSADVRAELIASALNGIENPKIVDVRQAGAGFVILVQGFHIATITPEEAAKHKVSAGALAKQWAARLAKALAMAPLELGSESVGIPLGDAKIIAVRGTKASLATIESSNDEIVTVERTAVGIRLRGKSNGSATVTVSAGDVSEMIQVAVRPYAASLPKVLKAEVTGAPAFGSTVRGAIAYALNSFVSSLPYARVSYAVPEAGAIGEGVSKSYVVRMRASAPNAFDRVGDVLVILQNSKVAKMPDQELWYCNEPEIVRKPQALFAARLRRDVPARLLYHHVNEASVPLYMRIQAVNDSDEPARIRVLVGDANPDRDPVRAGLEAGVKYLRSWMSGSGEIITIPPQSTVPITFRRLSPRETMSGLCSLRLLSGPENLLVRTDSYPPFELNSRWKEAEASMYPWREVGAMAISNLDTADYDYSVHIFPQAFKNEQVSYQVGGRYGFVRIGQKPISRADYGLSLDGNFGVIYNITASIQNPTQIPTDVEVVFEASAGYSGGLFIVNGALQKTPMLMAKQETRIAKIRMNPGVTKSMSITTLPLSGSSYPATITLRPVQTTMLSTEFEHKN